jgi:hypothetical protein
VNTRRHDTLLWLCCLVALAVAVVTPFLARSGNRANCMLTTGTYVAAAMRDQQQVRVSLGTARRELLLADRSHGKVHAAHAESATQARDAAKTGQRAVYALLDAAGGPQILKRDGATGVLAPSDQQREAFCARQWTLLRG